MNDWMLALGLATLKPLLAALLLPPVPWLVLMLLGARWLSRHRAAGWTLLGLGAAMTWACCTSAMALLVTRVLLDPPPALSTHEVAELKRMRGAGQKAMVVVLGGGREALAPEYGMSTLSPLSIERLRYGIWLSRETGLPLGFSGGLAPGSPEGAAEADIATRIAAREFGRPLQWAENQSSDTRENALRTVALLRNEGIDRLVLVTHVEHMPRALRHFERARAAARLPFKLQPAPMGLQALRPGWALSDFYPTTGGIVRTRYVIREWLGILAGA